MSTSYHHVLRPRPGSREPTTALGRGARAIVAHRDRSLRRRVARALRRDGIDVAVVADGYAVVSTLATWMLEDGRPADLVVAGAELRGWGGFELAEHLPSTDWDAEVLLTLDEEETRELERKGQPLAEGRPFVFQAPFSEDDLRTVALFVLRRKPGRRSLQPQEPVGPQHRTSRVGADASAHRRRIELEVTVEEAAAFDVIFELADERVAAIEPHVVGPALCTVNIRPKHRSSGLYEAHLLLEGSEQIIDVRRRAEAPVQALRHAFDELRMRVRRPRSGVEMKSVTAGEVLDDASRHRSGEGTG